MDQSRYLQSARKSGVRTSRFFANFTPSDGCWEWRGCKTRNGYGRYNSKGAHRVSYQLFKGEIPDGHDVCHACDNPACVNPDHLWVGTRLQNVRDCITKGRSKNPPRHVGVNHHSAKLTQESVIQIRAEIANGGQQTATAKKYGVSRCTLQRIVRREIWRHV